MVPRLRTCGSPTEAGTEASTGSACCNTGELAASAWRVMAPITIERPFCSTPVSPSTNERSISADGCARRCFITGMSEWPPANNLASGLRANRPAAWRTVVGRWKVKLYIVFSRDYAALLGGLARFGALKCRPHRIGGRRHGQIFGSDRVGDGVDHRGGRRDRTGLAAAFDAERIGRRLGFSQ